MRTFVVTMSGLMCLAPLAGASEGVVSIPSPYSVSATADRLEGKLKEQGMTVFARVRHSQGAKDAGLTLRPTELVLFGNPKVGTPLMQCQQQIAIDLPQKALIWEDADGKVWFSYNDPEYLVRRHGVQGCDEVVGKVRGALGRFAEAATAR
ncbi:DUF302 domain-containing protein [Marinobacter sp. X15-166B]|uniref:DUF302 domain-containing protein n=1 Tax=Marinobacter sp. X15-166B TaxID=1897620 RepID=UPI00085BFC57|nr:DUF302 domain-containing protein [Marinobacter sp. X15-166B]OEY65698.1 hypothetical protein BG841_03985 [Marinobacter sp. X15-166B]